MPVYRTVVVQITVDIESVDANKGADYAEIIVGDCAELIKMIQGYGTTANRINVLHRNPDLKISEETGEPE